MDQKRGKRIHVNSGNMTQTVKELARLSQRIIAHLVKQK